MFASLEQYQQQSYFDMHPTLLWLTEQGTWSVELFSAYFTTPDSDAWQMSFASDQEYADWLRRVQARSCIAATVTPDASDFVLTLSTCSYVGQDARFVCHGVLRQLAW